ncbi:histidine phosphatase family protein [uncultured Psychroserpens sp.]|uniref:SixA phosphatase family protein n=1 Tax=uncultured Psychroserpens sp. TaxID=255436 RepID=UPI00260536AB|nr:phosphoglycerate mutase family protein [uncultured Psychroserpens sp.]
MKYILILALSLFSLTTYSQDNETTSEITTYYLIRHAEKDRSDKTDRDPNLTQAGHERANNWSEVFKHVTFDAVYSTNYNRTKQTATPTAKAQGIELQFYDPRHLYSEEFAEDTQGKTVLIVGHSNTTPIFVNTILGEQKYQYMDDNDNGSLFIVTLFDEKKIDQVLHIN